MGLKCVVKIVQPRWTNDITIHVKILHCGIVLSTLLVTSCMTHTDMIACTLHSKVEPFQESEVGPIPLFMFQDLLRTFSAMNVPPTRCHLLDTIISLRGSSLCEADLYLFCSARRTCIFFMFRKADPYITLLLFGILLCPRGSVSLRGVDSNPLTRLILSRYLLTSLCWLVEVTPWQAGRYYSSWRSSYLHITS